ncbi:putative ferric-chelate reductase 1 homolog [Pollicipes pollicipes]|nr:putative ferric-chelate reductase 1 homolog [Pollicipes pollicipes]
MLRRPLQLLVLALAAMACRAYPGGVPAVACGDMTPGHGVPAQQSDMIYNVTVSGDSVQPSKRVKVTIRRGNQPPFKGFFVQVRRARDPDSSPALGRFFTRQHLTVSCEPGQDNGISHLDSKEKEAVTLLWQAPGDLDEDVVFRVTVVQKHDTFWVGHNTPRLRLARASDTTADTRVPAPSPAPAQAEGGADRLSPRVEPSAAASAPPAPPTSTVPPPASTEAVCTENCGGASSEASAIATIYDACLLSKGCFTRADSCIEGRNCDLMVTYARRPDGAYRLQLYGKHQPAEYLAMGLSRDAAMGDDAVIYCTDRPGGGYQIKHAHNKGKQSNQQNATSAGGELVTDFSSEYRDGFLLCEFTHAARFSVGDETADLASSDLHLMVSSGAVDADGGPRYHQTSRRVSGQPVELASARQATGDSGLLFRVHGALMLTAWVGTASTGMLLARYYKQTWVSRKLAGLDLWFQGHRALMVITVLLTLAGLACVVWQVGGWTTTPLLAGPAASPHPLLGVLCVCLAVLQPLMALCRCHPGTPRRALFNWLHWTVGSAAHILGIATVFFAVQLPAAQLPDWAYWVLAAFVLFHVAVHLVLSMQQCWSDRTLSGQKGHAEAYNMRDMGMNSYHAYQTDRPQEAPGSTLRRTVLGIYIVINLLFVTLLVLMVVLAPAEKWIDKILS